MGRVARVLLPLVTIGLIVGAVAGSIWAFMPRVTPYFTDGGAAIEEPAGEARVRDVLWTPATPLEGPVNSPADEYEARLTPEGDTVYFVRGRAGGGADIWYAERSGSGWGAGSGGVRARGPRRPPPSGSSWP